MSRKYLRVGEEKARGRQPARRAAAPQPPAAGVADQPVSQTAVYDTTERGRRPARAAVCRIPCLILCLAYVEHVRQFRAPNAPCGVHGRMASVIASLFSGSRPPPPVMALYLEHRLARPCEVFVAVLLLTALTFVRCVTDPTNLSYPTRAYCGRRTCTPLSNRLLRKRRSLWLGS